MRKADVAVVVPNEIVREGLKRVFGQCGFRIPYEFNSLAAALGSPRASGEVDAVLVDCDDPLLLRDDNLARLRHSFGGAKVVLMCSPNRCRDIRQMIEGVDGMVLTTSAVRVLVVTLELILLGEKMFPPISWERLPNMHQFAAPPEAHEPDPQGLKRLSKREMEVLQFLCQGAANKVIARQLTLSEVTVKVHVKAILRKTCAKNRTQAALMLRRFQPTYTLSKQRQQSSVRCATFLCKAA